MRIYLARHKGADGPEALCARPVSPPWAEAGKTVLVVDDEPSIRMLVTELLEDLRYTAIEAADGASGLELIQSDRGIDLLITDIGLPGGLNGRQLADAALVLRPRLKILMITGYTESAVLHDGRLGPGMRVLAKPFALDALASEIHIALASG